jgi:hypothetical protein
MHLKLHTKALGAAFLAAGLALSARAAMAESFSFGDFFFAGDTEGNSFSSITDQGTSYSVTGPGAGFTFLSQSPVGPNNWSGIFRSWVLVLSDNGAPGSVAITFDSPVDSITGFAAQPVATGPFVATLQAFDGSTLVGTSSYAADNNGIEGTIPYFSLTAPGITSIVISTTNDSLGIGLGSDNPGIPEPGAWALMLVGFGGLGAALRRRSSKERETMGLQPTGRWAVYG